MHLLDASYFLRCIHMVTIVGNRQGAQLLVGVAVTQVTRYARRPAYHGHLQLIVNHPCSQESQASAYSRLFPVVVP